MHHVNAVGGGDEVGAAGVGPRLMGEVVVKLPDARQTRFPEDPAGVDVHAAQHVQALDDQPAIAHLRLRTMAVPGKMPSCDGPPNQRTPRGAFTSVSLGNTRVRGVGVFVGPVGRARQRTLPIEAQQTVGRFRFGIGQLGRANQTLQTVDRHGFGQAHDAAERPQGRVGMGQEGFI